MESEISCGIFHTFALECGISALESSTFHRNQFFRGIQQVKFPIELTYHLSINNTFQFIILLILKFHIA